jgi:hypothetical protein
MRKSVDTYVNLGIACRLWCWRGCRRSGSRRRIRRPRRAATGVGLLCRRRSSGRFGRRRRGSEIRRGREICPGRGREICPRGRRRRTSLGRRSAGRGRQGSDRSTTARQRHTAGRAEPCIGVLAPRFLAPGRSDAHGVTVKGLAPDVALLAGIGPVRATIRFAQVACVGVLLGDLCRDLLGHAHPIARTGKTRDKVVGTSGVRRRQCRKPESCCADDCR